MAINDVKLPSGYLTDAQKQILEQLEKQNKTDRLAQNQDMGRDQFLNILLTQLANQNPLDPLKDKDFIAQMAQFSSVESMQAMVDNFEVIKDDIADIKDVIAQTDNDEVQDNTALLQKIDASIAKLNDEQIGKLNEMIQAFKAKESY